MKGKLEDLDLIFFQVNSFQVFTFKLIKPRYSITSPLPPIFFPKSFIILK